MDIITLIALIIFVICFWGYHYAYIWLTNKRKFKTKQYRADQAIHTWFKSVLEKNEYLLFVHQTRNIVMAVTFLATTVTVLLGFIFGFSTLGHGEPIGDILIEGYPFWLIVVTLIWSFLNLILSLRHYTRVTYLINTDAAVLKNISGKPPEEYLCSLFIKGNTQYKIGRRGVLYAMVVLIWYLNVWAFVLSTIIVTGMFLHNDK